MNTIKYELYGFSILVGMIVILLALPSGQDERRSIAEKGRSAFSQDVFRTK
ncbi:hypothetical protein [Antarctobacter jejuensis]|uniref:hypothetical protein n=1 Tax=Antarctobacter jejuensis TaxID=1439938 RepID=UPI003FD30DC1